MIWQPITWIGAALALLTGLVLGSFANLLADRTPDRLSIVRPRSHCPGCGRILSAWELIPLVGCLILRGRCQTCGRAIGLRTPVVEAFVGLMGPVWLLRLGPSPGWIAAMAATVLLTALFVTDQERRILPNRLNLALGLIGLGWSAWLGQGWLNSIIGLVLVGALVLLIGWGYRRFTGSEGMGGGDPKLAAALGAWLGPVFGLHALAAGAGLGAVMGLVLMVFGLADRKTALPLGTFLAAAGLVWLFLRADYLLLGPVLR